MLYKIEVEPSKGDKPRLVGEYETTFKVASYLAKFVFNHGVSSIPWLPHKVILSNKNRVIQILIR